MRVRPSDLYGIGSHERDPIRFWFDRAVTNFGMMVEQDLEQVGRNTKGGEKKSEKAIQQRLTKWLDFDGKLTNQRFAAPLITKAR